MKCPCLALLVLSLTVVIFSTGCAGTKTPVWPGFRGHHDGVVRDAEPPTRWSDAENVAWKIELPGPGSSSPIVLGDRICVTCYSGYGSQVEGGGDRSKLEHHVVCVDRGTGKVVWDRTVRGPLDKDARSIQLKEHGFASPTPVTDGKTIYAYFGRAGVVAVDLDGNVLWQADVGTPSKGAAAATNSVERGGKTLSLRWGAAASPILHEGLVIVNASEECNSLRAFDRKTGKPAWRYESSNLEGCASTPALVGPPGKKVLVMVLAGEVWGLDADKGKLLWSVETGTRGGMSPTPVADDQLVYTFGGSGKSFAIRFGSLEASEVTPEKKPSRVAWKGANLGIPSPVLHDGVLYLVRSSGIAECLNAEDGKQLAKLRLKPKTGSIYASPVVADGRMYVVSRRKGTFVYKADQKLELLAHNELKDDSQFNASPAVVDNQVFLRSDKFLYCIQAPAPQE